MTREAVDAREPSPAHATGMALGLKPRLVLADLATACAGWFGMLALYPMLEAGSTGTGAGRVAWVLLAVAVTMALLAAQDLYLARVCSVRHVELQGLARSAVGAALALVAVEQLLGAELPLREVWLASLTTFVALAIERTAFDSWLRRHRAAGRFVRDLVLVGADADAVELAAVMREHPELGFRVCGYIGRPGCSDLIEAPHLGDIGEVITAVRRARASGALVIASALDSDVLNHVVRSLLDDGVRVQLSSGIRGIAQQRFRATPLAYEPLFFIEPASLTPWQVCCKRTIDVIGAGIGLLLTAPVLALAGIGIKLSSPGPILFRQQRVGRGGELFTFYKLRTMVDGAESQRARLECRNQRASGPLFKLAADPRVTRIGRFLRATSIDELPQLWNVLRGSMSLVGPRPALPSEVERFDERLRTRTTVAPGLTGLWQIEARDNPAFGPYRRLDLFYVENWSPLLDIGILATTALRVAGRCMRHATHGDAQEAPETIVLD